MSQENFTLSNKDTPVAVTGANGRIGRILQRFWQAETDLLPRWLGRIATGGIKLEHCCDPLPDGPEVLARHFEGCLVVLALAGPVPGGASMSPETQADLTRVTLHAARLAAVPQVILLSSAAVYGRPNGPIKETSATQPVSLYGAAKLAMENVAFDARPPPQVTILRLANVAGADQLLGGATNSPVRLDWFDNHQGPLRSYIGVLTLAQVLARLVRLLARNPEKVPALLNLAQPGLVLMQSLLDAAGLEWVKNTAPSMAIPKVELDVSTLQTLMPLAEADPVQMIEEWRQWQAGK